MTAPSSPGTDSTGNTPARAVAEPTLEAAADEIDAGLEHGTLVTVFGRCTVEYDGRASSSLPAGNRFLLLKPDGTTLVHTATGQKPVNWQPPGCDHTLDSREGTLSVRATRKSPEEVLTVTFQRIFQVGRFELDDPHTLEVSGTEADLKDRILSRPSLIEPGFQPLATERQTPAGAVDIYGRDSQDRIVVVELKRRRVGPDAVSQLRRYVTVLEDELHTDATVRGILVAPSVTPRAERLLAERGLEFVSLDPTGEA